MSGFFSQKVYESICQSSRSRKIVHESRIKKINTYKMTNPYVNTCTKSPKKKKRLQARLMKLKSLCKAMFRK